MSFQFKNIIQVGIDAEIIEKEINEARYDLKSAENSIDQGNYKWAIVQSYYSMFHAFRGLLFSRGYKEKSHAGLKFAVKSLFVNNGIISENTFAGFDFAMKAREMADYNYIYDEKLASEILESTRDLINELENLF